MKRLFILFVSSFLVVVFAMAQENVLEPLDIAKLKTVGDVVLSPDGKLAAYTVLVQADPLVENKPAHNELHLFNVNTEKSVPFITRGNARAMAFRPDYQSLTFLDRLDKDKTTSLYQISLLGGEATKIFSFETSISSYEWSPDGETLAFIAREPMEVEKEKLPYEPEVYEANLVFNRAFITNLDDEILQLELKEHFNSLQWSPDGMTLAVVTVPTPLVDDFYMKRKISFVNSESLKVISSVDHKAKLGAIAWSTDSENIAFIAGAHLNDPVDGRLFTASIGGGKPMMLAEDFDGKFDGIQWMSQNRIQFVASKGVWSIVGSITSDGSDWTEIISGGETILHGFDQESGVTAYLGDSPKHPMELFLLKKGDMKPRRVTNLNPWMKDEKLAQQDVIKYIAQDGLEIEGLLIRPLMEEEGVRYPLITVVHGGPESHYDNGWITGYSSPGQMAAAKGFAVFYPNYRGSTGRGLEFTMSSQGDLAGKEFDDIVDGVDYLIEMGLVDGDKVGVTGGSYGGYATGWLCTKYTDRFAAGVMFVGISDNISKWGTSDIPEELYLVHARKRIWDDYEFFLERSPIFYADQTKTPMLIMAGKEDTRVHPSQSIELYRHIKTRTNTPVSLVLYPGEGHGNRNSTARYDYNMRQVQWFENYLMKKAIRP